MARVTAAVRSLSVWSRSRLACSSSTIAQVRRSDTASARRALESRRPGTTDAGNLAGGAAYVACSRRRAREARRLMRLPQTEVLHQTRAWFFELS